MKISKETICTLNGLGYNVWAHDSNMNAVSFEKGDHIYIDYRSIKTPKGKEVTAEWLLNKISDNGYINLSGYLAGLFGTLSVYPASYGIGVASLIGFEKDVDSVKNKLNDLGITYRCEYSECRFVYRFIISKDSKNMRVLESLK